MSWRANLPSFPVGPLVERLTVLLHVLAVAISTMPGSRAQAAMADEIASAASLGTLLTQAVNDGRELELRSVANHAELNRRIKADSCPGFAYKSYAITAGSQRFLYVVASKGRDMIIGRHWRIPLNGNKADLARLTSSTVSCLNLGTPAANALGVAVTHLGPFPNEFHVLQSNLHGIAVYVATDSGMYVVESGRIEAVETGD
jgi:hypothetical protein